MRKRLTAALLCRACCLRCFRPRPLPRGRQAAARRRQGAPYANTTRSTTKAAAYTEGTEEVPCTHEHDEDCYKLVTECVHEHTAECYPEESVSENTATPS